LLSLLPRFLVDQVTAQLQQGFASRDLAQLGQRLHRREEDRGAQAPWRIDRDVVERDGPGGGEAAEHPLFEGEFEGREERPFEDFEIERWKSARPQRGHIVRLPLPLECGRLQGPVGRECKLHRTVERQQVWRRLPMSTRGSDRQADEGQQHTGSGSHCKFETRVYGSAAGSVNADEVGCKTLCRRPAGPGVFGPQKRMNGRGKPDGLCGVLLNDGFARTRCAP
jgi:hypothetical protein